MQSYGVKQWLKGPTPIAEHSMTIIDHFWHNRDDFYNISSVPELGISDHELVYCTRKKVKSKEMEFVWTRTYRKFNEVAFLCSTHRAKWQPVFNSTGVNSALEIFSKIFSDLVNCHAPFEWVTCKGVRTAWVTDELLALINNRTHSIRRFKKTRRAGNWESKQHAINVVYVLKKDIPCEHVRAISKECAGNAKATWHKIKELWLTSLSRITWNR